MADSSPTRPPSRVTQAEIARRVGASRKQVFNFLSGRHEQLSAELRRKISEEVERTAYAPNFQVSLIQGGENPFVAVVMNPGLSPVFQRFLEGLSLALSEQKLHAVAVYQGPGIDFDAMIREDRFGAVISVLGSMTRATWELLLKKRLPVAAYIGPHDGQDLKIFRVLHDHRNHMADLCAHLREVGHESLGVLSVGELALRYPGWNDEQLAALRQEAKTSGLILRDDWILQGGSSPEGIRRAVDFFLSLHPRPRALLAHNDMVAWQVLNLFLSMGIRVPEDVALIGRDNLELSAHTAPPLTSLDLNFEAVHRQLLSQLLAQRVGKSTPTSQVVRGKLVVRKST